MSSREQSREIRTNSQRAPPLIMSLALTSEMWKFKPSQGVHEKICRFPEKGETYHVELNGIVQAQYVA